MAKACKGIDALIGPQLARVIRDHEVYMDGRRIDARAADGTVVTLGWLIDKKSSDSIELYLTACPTPDRW